MSTRTFLVRRGLGGALALASAVATGLLWGCGGGAPPSSPIVVVAPGGPAALPRGPDLFDDVTAKTGIVFTYRNGEEAENYAIIESLGGGLALLDFDGDGRLDIFLTAGGFYDGKKVLGHPCRLYRNLGDMRFEDISESAGLTGPWPYSHGATVGDYNRDG